RQLARSTAVSQIRPNFMSDLKVQKLRLNYCFPDKRPMSNSKNLAESTFTATLALGTNVSRTTGDVLVLAKVGADPRICMVSAACFSLSGRRCKSPDMGL